MMMEVLEKHIAEDFESLYVRLRQKEGRLFGDHEVLQLPEVLPSHIHYKEWLVRKRSAEKVISYLKRKKHPLSILEIGCGNGWLAHCLSRIPGSKVIGTDINFTELQQAARVFHDAPNLHFLYAGQAPAIFKENEFNTIIFAASIQYFPSLKDIVESSIKLLKPGGEIHIIDSPFYSPLEVLMAKQRTRDYYESMGFPQLADFYFHHSLVEIKKYTNSIRYEGKTIRNWFVQNKNPFPWICIKANNH
jgi:ubiquinone/menaquinone biosynthesis C-methylase UbiE